MCVYGLPYSQVKDFGDAQGEAILEQLEAEYKKMGKAGGDAPAQADDAAAEGGDHSDEDASTPQDKKRRRR